MFPFLIDENQIKNLILSGTSFNESFYFQLLDKFDDSQSVNKKSAIQASFSVYNNQPLINLNVNNKNHQFQLKHCELLRQNEIFFTKSKQLLEKFFFPTEVNIKNNFFII